MVEKPKKCKTENSLSIRSLAFLVEDGLKPSTLIRKFIHMFADRG